MAKYLDYTGLEHFWGKIKAKINGLTAENIAYSNELIEADGNVKAALDVLAQVASEYASHDHGNTYVPSTRKIADLALSSDITAADLTAKLTNATSKAAGTMTAAQYTKLDALPTNATLQNTYAKKSDISSVYKAAGPITPIDGAIASPGDYLTAANLGKVYHVTGAFTTDKYFTTPEASKTYPAGTNIVVVAETWQDGEGHDYQYRFDILAGFVDLSNYATKDDLDDITITVETISNTEIDTIVAR